MFTGDRSGDWLYRALHKAGFANRAVAVSKRDGLVLRDCYITAAVRCAPPGNRPAREEFAHCQPYLARELTILGDRLRVVIVLGRVAMESFLRAWRVTGRAIPSPKPDFCHGGRWTLPPITLLASYHPSQRNTQTGLLKEGMFNAVFREATRLLRSNRPT